MAVSMPPWLFQQLFDNDGLILAGGQIFTYASLTTTPLATYTDATETVAASNPIIADASGRTEIWLATNIAYTFVLKTTDGVTIKTIDDVIVNPLGDAAPPASQDIYFLDFDESPPTANQALFGATFRRPITFPANFLNSGLALDVPPAIPFVATCRKNSTSYFNGTVVGTLTVQANGTYAFATTDAVEVSVGIDDWLTWYGPATPDASAMRFRLTMVGFVTGSAPGDFVTVDTVTTMINAALLALMCGRIVLCSNSTIPSGWLECNGAAISRTTYASLFNKIGTENGVGNGTTTFNLPDFRGYFIRGWDHGAGRDVDRAAQFDEQLDAFQGHLFQIVLNTDPNDTGKFALEVQDSDATTTTITTGPPITDGLHGTPRIASETRGINKAAIYIICTGIAP